MRQIADFYETRKCARLGCTATFRVLIDSSTLYCTPWCEDKAKDDKETV